MRPRLPVFIVTVFLFIIGSVSISYPYVELDGGPVGITAKGAIPVNPGPLLDDFNRQGVNTWGCSTSTVVQSGSGASISVSYPNDTAVVFGAGGRSLQLTYNVTAANSWAAYVTSLGGADISSYNYLSFWVKGAVGGELFKIELHHASYDPNQAVGYNDNYKAEVYVTDYLDTGVPAPASGWKKVVIPLDAFANINDRAKMKELVITFENSQSITNGSPTSGTVYIDNISFGKQFQGFVRIDHFSDKVGKNSLGGNCVSSYPTGQGVLGTSTYTNTANQYDGYPYGLDFHFQGVADPNYYSYVSIVGGGDTGGIQQPRNFGSYQNLSLSVRSGSSDVTCLQLELHCPTYTNNYFHLFNGKDGQDAITTNWTHFVIALTNFTRSGWNNGTPITSTDLANLGEIVFTRAGWFATYHDFDQGVTTGDFYIDRVQFEVSNYTPDVTPPAPPSAPVISGSGSSLTVTCNATSRITDPSMENVTFYWRDSTLNWHIIGSDYNTEDASYSATWDTSGLAAGSYPVKAVAMDAAGNIMSSANTTYTK